MISKHPSKSVPKFPQGSRLPLWLILWLTCVTPLLAQLRVDFSEHNSHNLLARLYPILIAHRGGVITEQSPECSRNAIRLAGQSGYDMVELDIRRSRDGIPIVFHDRSLKKACGRPETIAELTAAQIRDIRYLQGGERIILFEEALAECKRQQLGLMLDIKTGKEDIPFLKRIDHLIQIYGFENATITFTGTPQARANLKHARFTLTSDELTRLRRGERLLLPHRFWFGLPKHLPPEDVQVLKRAAVVILPAINTFRYPRENHQTLAERDVKRLLKQGVHGFQIDSVYGTFFRYITRNSTPALSLDREDHTTD